MTEKYEIRSKRAFQQQLKAGATSNRGDLALSGPTLNTKLIALMLNTSTPSRVNKRFRFTLFTQQRLKSCLIIRKLNQC